MGITDSSYGALPFAVLTDLQSPALAAFLKAFAGEKWRYGEGLFVSIFHHKMQSSNATSLLQSNRPKTGKNWPPE